MRLQHVSRHVVQSPINLEIRDQIKALRVFMENGWNDDEEFDWLITSWCILQTKQ